MSGSLTPALHGQHGSERAAGYLPRRPKETLLYEVVSRHLDEFLELAAERYARPLPRYVVEALRGYLSCGDFARGVVRCRCETCGHDVLVPFTCGKRTTCPSCAARRMANAAAFLMDRVLPHTALRQWVLSLPFELRPLAVAKPAVVTAVGRMFIESVFEHYRRLTEIPATECAAVLSLHRAGDSLNCNPHFHAVLLDGVLFRDPGAPSAACASPRIRFAHAPPPRQAELDRIIARLRDRTVTWLRRRGYLDEREVEERSNELPEQGALDACVGLAMRGSGLAKLADESRARSADAACARPRHLASRPFTAALDGFNLNAAVTVDAEDDEARERLCRYCLRPPLALSRLCKLPDGRIGYRLRYPIRGATHRIMEPLELLARVAALVAPPRHPLVRYFGAVSSHSSWRKLIVPRLPPSPHDRRTHRASVGEAARSSGTARPPTQAPASDPPGAAEGPSTPGAPADPGTLDEPASSTGDRAASSPAGHRTLMLLDLSIGATELGITDLDQLNVITARHLDRLLGGELLATSPRLDWAKLMRRTYGVDLSRCPRCSGPMKPIAVLTDPTVIAPILDHLEAQLASADRPSARAPPAN